MLALFLSLTLAFCLVSGWHCSVTVLNTAEGLKRPCRPTRHFFEKQLLKFNLKKKIKDLKNCDLKGKWNVYASARAERPGHF